MPQVDLETLVCGGSSNGRKIACADDPSIPENSELPEIPSDFPAESYYVSREDEFDWFDRNAFYERKGSTKGNSNSNSTPTISISKRYYLNLKSKASIIGLPKLQKTNYLDGQFRRNCKPVSTRFFPKRSRSYGKSNVPLSEPTSPKVSCIGRVRSKRDRSRRRRLHLKKEVEIPLPIARSEKKTGLWKTLKIALKLGRRKRLSATVDRSTPTEKPLPMPEIMVKKSLSVNEPAIESATGLGGLKRFASGRRSDSWSGYGVDLEMDGSLTDSPGKAPVWTRRGVGPSIEVRTDHDWEYVGPASV